MSVGFTDFAFAFCGLAFIALAVSLRPGAMAMGLPRLRLRIAALFTVLWAVAGWAVVSNGLIDAALSRLLSYALVGVWIWQLAPYARAQGQPHLLLLGLEGAGALTLVIALGWMLAAARVPALPAPSLAVLSMLGLALCAFGLFALEQIHRNTHAGALSAMRWLGLGVGGVLVAELMICAEALLVGTIPEVLKPVRALIHGLCALAMVRGARRMPEWQLGLSVSRHVAFYVGSILLVGGYLVLMALAGWLMLRYAGQWHPVASVGFALMAALALGLSLFSGGLFKRLKVLISAHFYPHRYDYRVEWMRFTRTLSEPAPDTDVPQRAIRALAQIIGSPSGSLWRREPDGERYVRAADWPGQGESSPSLSVNEPLPVYMLRTGWLVDLAELARKPDLYGNLCIDPQPLGMPADALLVPLLHIDQLYGWIVLHRAPRQGQLDFEDRDLLKVAGRHVAAHLAQLDVDARLAEAHQFETYNRMTAFVMHDLKNIAAQLRLISQNAERHRRNPEFVEDAFRTVAAAAARMTKLISQLASGREGGTLQTLDLASCAERAALRCSGNAPVPQVVAEERPSVFADMEHLTAVIEHAIRNAQDATPAGGEIRIEVGRRGQRPLLAVVDTGSGMDARFLRERLFRPFDTTKGSRGMGVGAFQIREYLRSLGGEVEVQSEPGRGTRFTMIFADQSILSMDRKAG